MPTTRNKSRALETGPCSVKPVSTEQINRKRTSQLPVDGYDARKLTSTQESPVRKRKSCCAASSPNAKRQHRADTQTAQAEEAALEPPLPQAPTGTLHISKLHETASSSALSELRFEGTTQPESPRQTATSWDKGARPPVPRTPATTDRLHRLSGAYPIISCAF